ncbi:MAG: NAD(P)/FAD-dependent oxidoreductase [Candidatus Levyibacteriota bacterium]
MKKTSSIMIIGGGIVGCAVALELSEKGWKNITVVERNKTIPGLNQSSTNEGTIHSGIYHPKSVMPLKAKLSAEGNRLMYKFLKKHHLPYKKIGKLIIATNVFEESYLDFFLSIGKENGVARVKKISGEKAKKLEPNLGNVTAALRVPSTGSSSPDALIRKVKELAEKNGVRFLLQTTATVIKPAKKQIELTLQTSRGKKTLLSDFLINSAGLYSDEIAKMINPKSPYVIEPARGEFYAYDSQKARSNIKVNMHIYQPPYCYTTKNGNMEILKIPASRLKTRLKKGDVIITAGVHISPAYAKKRDRYGLNKITISPLKTTGLGKGNYKTKLHPAKDYITKINYFFPHLTASDIKKDHTGIMSPLKNHRDFVIEKDKKFPNCINLIGMESPAWTSCFAIAKYVETLIK